MFSNLTIGILVGLSVAAWVYAKVQHHTGGNTKSSITVAAVVGAIAVLVVTMLMSLIHIGGK